MQSKILNLLTSSFYPPQISLSREAIAHLINDQF